MRTINAIAKSKLRYFKCNNELVGYLTPAEIICLVEDGYKLTESNRHKEEMARVMLKEGKSGGTWVYFKLKNGTVYRDYHEDR
jgi:hypothetical protein